MLAYRRGKTLGISGPWETLGNFGATESTGEDDDAAAVKQRYLQGTEDD